MKEIYTLFFVLPLLFVSACSNDNKTTISEETADSTKVVIQNLEDLNLSQEKLQTYIIRSSADDKPATENDIGISSDSSDVVALIDDGEEPVLLSRKFANDDSVTLSLASTAEMMVLFNPQFSGRESSDPRELSNRIRTHEDFGKLEESIKIAITSENPCPIAPRCNAYSARMAAKIASEIEIEDLYEGSN